MNLEMRIDKELCQSCETCVRECARHLPVARRNSNGYAATECIKCFHCYAVCPHGAIRLDDDEPTDLQCDNSNIDASQILHLFAQRRSTRQFTDKSIENRIIEELLHAARYIPSGGNSHGHKFTVLTDGTRRQRLTDELRRIYSHRQQLLRNSALTTVFSLFADSRTRSFLRDKTYLERVRYLLDRFDHGEDPIFYNAPVVIIVHSAMLIPTPLEDGVLAAYNIVLSAQAMGLGSCFVSLAQNAVNSSRKCKRIIGIDNNEQILAVVVVGRPKVRFIRPVPKPALPVSWIE